MSVLAVIPARHGSVRFPAKALAARTGKPLVQHVYERAAGARSLDRVLVATDDERIAAAVRGFGGECVLTRSDHPNGTSRIAEAVERLVASGFKPEIVVNVQGDEPEIDPGVIDLAVEALRSRPDCPMATVASPFGPEEDAGDANIVKVVLDAAGRALYFSRAPIPFARSESPPARPLKHVGLYAYRRAFLLEYVSWPPTPLEETERLEQLRVLERGHAIAVAVAPVEHHGIDTPEQYEAFVRRTLAAERGRASDGRG